MRAPSAVSLVVGLMLIGSSAGQYFGEYVGMLTEYDHDVNGKVYIVDSKTLRLREFFYDGKGPDAFFWVGTGTATPSSQGLIALNEMGNSDVLSDYTNADITITLPDGVTASNIKWLSIWCRQFSADFGSVMFPGESTCVPAPAVLGSLTTYDHEASSGDITAQDTKTIHLAGFSYDGMGPDAFFLVGTGAVSPSNGYQIGGKLRAYTDEDVTLTLPPGVTIKDIDWISVYCVQVGVNFGDLMFTGADQCVPPSMKMTYYGEPLGSLSTLVNGVAGDVFVVDSRRIRIKGFSYNGDGPDAFFYIGIKGTNGDAPEDGGMYLRDERGSDQKLGEYVDADIVLNLPNNVLIAEVAWFSVWCKSVSVNFGSLVLPDTFRVPAPVNIGQISTLGHGVGSGDVMVLDKRTLHVSGFSYDGQGPDAFFLVGSGSVISGSGTKLATMKEGFNKLGAYNNQDVRLVLPEGVTVDDIDWLSVYCREAKVDFGNLRLPEMSLFVPPYVPPPMAEPLANCEAMTGDFTVAWEVKGTDIEFEFVGAIDTQSGYMAFGMSGSDSGTQMVGSDPMIVYLENGVPRVQDYFITSKSLCSAGTGACPDDSDSGTNNVEMLSSNVENGVTTVRLRRPLAAGDASSKDKAIPTTGDVNVVWAVGEVNSNFQVTKHTDVLRVPLTVNFGRAAANNCQETVTGSPEEEVEPWPAPSIACGDTNEFWAKIGPTGGDKGYPGITGQTSWGIAIYLNGVLIPEITVVRGQNYTFKVSGGDDPSNKARYHPVYITDDPLGGFEGKTAAEKTGVNIYAGATAEGDVTVGPLCSYTSSSQDPASFSTFGEYKATLTEDCATGDPGMFTWTPDADTPDLVYYQCYTHNYLGWKIHVVDECEVNSAPRTSVAQPLLLLLLTLRALA